MYIIEKTQNIINKTSKKQKIITGFIIILLLSLGYKINAKIIDIVPLPKIKLIQINQVIKQGNYKLNVIEHLVEKNQNLSQIFAKAGIDYKYLANLVNNKKYRSIFRSIAPGDKIKLLLEKNDYLNKIIIKQKNKEFEYSFINNGDNNFLLKKKSYKYTSITKLYQGTIKNSFYESALNLGMTDYTILSFAQVFEASIDFIYDIRENDSFYVMVEEFYKEGNEEPSYSKILKAGFTLSKNNNKTIEAIRYEKDNKLIGFYTTNGGPMQKRFLRLPLNFTRISSKFNLNRLHPIFKTKRPHYGVDYAAPIGTPIWSTANGIVDYAGWSNGYGYMVRINHGGGYKTIYAHMSRIAKGMNRGRRVSQKQIIGYVGKTGWATGPHLHYEFQIKGRSRNPLKVVLPKPPKLQKNKLKEFFTYSAKINHEYNLRKEFYSSMQAFKD